MRVDLYRQDLAIAFSVCTLEKLESLFIPTQGEVEESDQVGGDRLLLCVFKNRVQRRLDGAPIPLDFPDEGEGELDFRIEGARELPRFLEVGLSEIQPPLL